MALISAEDRQTLQTLFAKELQDEVTITYCSQRESVLIIPGQECSYCVNANFHLAPSCAW